MGMFAKTIESPPFGTLTSEGLSKVWETDGVSLPTLGEKFSVRVHGTKDGPTQKQTEAMLAIAENAERIKTLATSHIIKFLNESEVVPSEITLSTQNLWDYLYPCFIEVNDESYLGPESASIAIGYDVPWVQDQLIFIHTINGRFNEVHAE